MLKKFKTIAQVIGFAGFILLAMQGALSIMQGHPAFADILPPPAPQRAPLLNGAWGESTVPTVMNYQGALKDAEGNPLSGYYTMTFNIYDDVTAPFSETLWTEEHISVTVRAGHFSVLLGDNNPISPTLFLDPDRFIGVTVAPYAEMAPRQRFASVPYAVHSFEATYAVTAANAELLNEVPATVLAPPGGIVAYGGGTAPEGWLLCDGSEVSRAQYPDLFAAIGTAHGEGDGSTTFNLPDYRGRFLRGVDNGAGRDPDAASRTGFNGGNTGDAVGSVQEDQLQSHAHGYSRWNGSKVRDGDDSTHAADNRMGNYTTGNPTTSTAGSVRHGAETRPVNAYVNWIIKY